ncbi:MAG: hypothetical protein MRY74_10025 [Neomegalonema sp.]|nr:hypothetical protein [Neomegalonema sp.]
MAQREIRLSGAAARAGGARVLRAMIAAILAISCGAAPIHGALAEGVIRVDSAAKAEVAFFLLETHLDADATLEDMRRWYADRVSYYGRGLQDRALILTDKKYYLDRWPTRRMKPDMSTLKIVRLDDGAFEITIEVEFTVANAETSVSGRTRVELTLHRAASGFKITRESGRILSRRGQGE